MITWNSEQAPHDLRVGLTGILRAILRAVPLVFLVLLYLFALLVVRLFERPIFGLRRPVTSYLTQYACRFALIILGLGYRRTGNPMRERGAVVANHASWLDIFALNARKRIYFVAKSEVANWPFIGFIVRSAGTVFIKRDPSQARVQRHLFEKRLILGQKLLFFPEGTSSDNLRVLPFKSTLFAAFFAPELHNFLYVQPVTLTYGAHATQDPRFYAWWGDMGFGAHFLSVLGARHRGTVTVTYHTPLKVSDFADRKALALACQRAVSNGLQLSPAAQAKI